MLHIPFDNQFVGLGNKFYVKTDPTPVANPGLIAFNDSLAEALGITGHDQNSADIAALFAGNVIPDGAEPLAMAYAGHQFGHYNPQLGDGRAILLGEILTPDGKRVDLQLKGSVGHITRGVVMVVQR